MSFPLTEEQRLIRDTVIKFAKDKVAPLAEHLDKTGEFPYECTAMMKEMGLMGLTIPEEYGGQHAGDVAVCLAMEELSKVCLSTAGTLATHFLATEPMLIAGSEEQKKRYLPDMASGAKLAAFGLTEPSAGSDVSGVRTNAVKDGDSYILNGSKCFISNGGEADIYTIFAKSTNAEGKSGLSAFIVEKGTPGFEFGKKEDKMGMRGSATRELIFTDCRIPAANLMGQETKAFKVVMQTLDHTRYIVGSQAIGVARGAFDAAVSYAKQRVQFGKPIISNQAIQFMLAEMATDIYSARLTVYEVARERENGEKNYSAKSAMSKLLSSEMVGRVVDQALQIHGGYGYMKDYAIERYYRDARILRIYEGTSEIQKMVIAAEILNGRGEVWW